MKGATRAPVIASYDVIMSGGTSAFAANSGRIAGRNALAYIKG